MTTLKKAASKVDPHRQDQDDIIVQKGITHIFIVFHSIVYMKSDINTSKE